MSTFVLLPGAGSTGWYWHLVEPELWAAGHDTLAVDLPSDDESAGLAEYTQTTLDVIGERRDVVLVAQSMGGLTAPLVADRVAVRMIVLVAAMVPAPGETGGDWWTNTGHEEARRAHAIAIGIDPDDWDPATLFLHDVPAAVATEAAHHVHEQASRPFGDPWPLAAWPAVPTRFLLCRDDRFFPAQFQRRVVADRLGIVPDEIGGGHLPALARPVELALRLLAYLDELDKTAA